MAEVLASDSKTAKAFSTSWNNLPEGSVYTVDQFEDWFEPLKKEDIQGKAILELGCGNGSLLVHITSWNPSYAEGVDLGASIISANKNIEKTGFKNIKIIKHDLTTYRSAGFDVVYCIGVLHHLKKPFEGFKSVIENTKSGGKFHCWVYAKEGNAVIRYIVDPIRVVASRLPWWVTKYFVATPLSALYYPYAQLISSSSVFRKFPLYEYSKWICKRGFLFFRHVAFDQLVTPQTIYIDKATIEKWLSSFPQIVPSSTYTIFRNGNSWKFGGTIK
jgi:SAM-dependent methyltransferase